MGNGLTGNRIDIVSTAEGDFVVSTSSEGEPRGHTSQGRGANSGVSSFSDPASAVGSGGSAAGPAAGSAASRRPWIGIHFECCDVYQRVYRKPEDDHYLGFCPKCGRRIRLRVAADGVDAKFFRATPG